MLLALAVSIVLSLFLARTIVQPLRAGRAAVRCGWGASARSKCRAWVSAATRSACWPAPFPT
jgi:peptidoglycan/LPS O-acetylase OafA/YrhL